MFSVIYRYLPSPSANVTWKAAGIAGGIVALLWEAAKQAFAFYTSKYANYDKVYGTLGGVVGLVFWIYYTSMILLLGAEIANLYGDAQRAKRKKSPA
jgi:membrane protein